MCRWGFSNIIKTLKKVADQRLRVYVVWLPIFGGDFKGEGRKLSRRFPDKRVTYFSDPEEFTGKLWQRVLGLDDIAWDVYLIYGAGAAWSEEPSPPDFWMHQLDGVTKAPVLNQATFESKLKAILKTLDKSPTTSRNALPVKSKATILTACQAVPPQKPRLLAY